jgi:hypothetical protein
VRAQTRRLRCGADTPLISFERIVFERIVTADRACAAGGRPRFVRLTQLS